MVKRNDGTSKEDICQNQFTAYVVLAVKRKRQAYIKKKMRDKEKQTKTERTLYCCGVCLKKKNIQGTCARNETRRKNSSIHIL